MRKVKTLDELTIPQAHKAYLRHMLEYLSAYPVIEKVFLFGSCANGNATPKSDIDLFLLGTNMTDNDEWNIAWNCPRWENIEYVPCDILSGTHETYEEMSKVPGMVQYVIGMKGVDISGLLRVG